MRNLCSIGMRGGSKGVKNKNLRKINGKPLLAYTIEQALESKLFEHIVVTTDSREIQEELHLLALSKHLKNYYKKYYLSRSSDQNRKKH